MGTFAESKTLKKMGTFFKKMGTLSTKKENFITKMWTEIKNFLNKIINNYNGAVQWRLRNSLTITLSEMSERRNHLLKCQRDKCKKTHFFGIWLTFSKLFEIVREIFEKMVFLQCKKTTFSEISLTICGFISLTICWY